MLVVESLDHALARGAKIYAEIVGYGATSDGYDMVAPSGEGAMRCMQQAMATVSGPIDYINAHGTSTPAGDIQELKAVKAAFANTKVPLVNSTKSLSGHSLGAAGVQEAIYALLMQQNNFISASANIENLDPDADGVPVVQKRIDNIELNRIMSNSFGFGGTNASLVFQKYAG
jgi:3-oxoacyl-[acyl-carrier-protein] synthase-1